MLFVNLAHSSSGLGRWPLTPETGVQFPYELPYYETRTYDDFGVLFLFVLNCYS